MNANTKERLIDAGWSLERQIDVDEVIDTLNSRGFLLTDKNIFFLKQYGLLEFELENRNEIFKDIVHKNFNPLKAIGKNLYKESLEYLEDEYDIEGINTVIPIGENDNGNMLILCTCQISLHMHFVPMWKECKIGKQIIWYKNCLK